jgi:hypothetical protein
MHKASIEAEDRANVPIVIEIIEPMDSTLRDRSRAALVLVPNIRPHCIHLTPDEYTIVPQKEPEAKPG